MKAQISINMFYFFYEIIIFRIKQREKDDIRSAYVYFNFFWNCKFSQLIDSLKSQGEWSQSKLSSKNRSTKTDGDRATLKPCESYNINKRMVILFSQVSAVSLCGVCPPGHFVEKECTGTSNRICKPCPLGTYMDKASLTNKCHKCKKCSGLQEVSSECTATTNTKCKCSKGYYFHTELAICYPCSSCKEGTGVSKECSLTSDTVCEVCKVGIFYELSQYFFEYYQHFL